jgi:hypothetical protein
MNSPKVLAEGRKGRRGIDNELFIDPVEMAPKGPFLSSKFPEEKRQKDAALFGPCCPIDSQQDR